MSHSEDRGSPPLSGMVDDATLREHFSRLTDRFALPLASLEGAGQSPSGSGSLSPRGGLSTSNSASTGDTPQYSKPVDRTSAPRGHHSPPVQEVVGKQLGENGVKAVFVLNHGNSSVPAAVSAVPEQPPVPDGSRRRHARPSSAPAPQRQHRTQNTGSEDRGASRGQNAHATPSEPPHRPSRPVRPASSQAGLRRASLQVSHASSNTSSRASTPRSMGGGAPGSRPRPASAQPVSRHTFGATSSSPALPAGAVVAGASSTPRERRNTGRVYVRRLVRPKTVRAGIPASPYYTNASGSGATTNAATTATTTTTTTTTTTSTTVAASSSSPTSSSSSAMRVRLSRPTLVARHDVFFANGTTVDAANGTPNPSPSNRSPRAPPSPSLSRPHTHQDTHGPTGFADTTLPFTPPPPMTTLRNASGLYGHSAPVVVPLNVGDVIEGPDDYAGPASSGGIGNGVVGTGAAPSSTHSGPRRSPSLSSPSNGMGFTRLGEFTPRAPAATLGGGSRRSSGRRLSRSGSSYQGSLPQPPLPTGQGTDAAVAAGNGAPYHPSHPSLSTSAAAAASIGEPFVSLTAGAAASRSTSPDTLPSPSALAHRLRERGNECFRRAAYTEAIGHYSEGLQLQPSNEVLACNRAAAYLMSFRYAAALVDCKWVLLHAPKNLSAHWRAAKSFLYTNRLPEARRAYRTARQLSEEDFNTASVNLRHDSVGSRCGSLGSVHASGGGGHSGNIKWLKDRRSICAEEAALPDVEAFWQQMREGDWPAAVNTTARLMDVFGADGPTSAIWQAHRLEALLHVDAREAIDKVRTLRVLYPDCLDLIFVESRALFYCAHDDSSTRQSLALLEELRSRAAIANAQLHDNVEQFARQLYSTTHPAVAKGGASLAAENDVASWAQLYQWKEDSRLVQLQRAIELFAKYRDDGNAAYQRADWTAAHNAYTRCLQVDPENRSLMSTTYCNRSAVAMQSGRWKDALTDAHAAIELNPLHTKAVSRRARIYLHLFQQQEERLLNASSPHSTSRDWVRTTRDAMVRYLDAAVEDFKSAVALAPQDDKLRQDLQEAMQCRHSFLRQQQQQQQQQQQDQQHYSRPFSGSYSRSSSTKRPDSAFTGHSHAQARRGPQFFTGDDFDDERHQEEARQQRGHPHGGGRAGGSRQGKGQSGGVDANRAVLLSYIEVLQLPTSAYTSGKIDQRTLTKAYRDAALRWHPDKWVSATAQEKELAEVRFKEVTVAYTALKECAA